MRTGMHRSGTSMVMSLLHGLGLHVGNQRNIKWTLAAAGRGEFRRLDAGRCWARRVPTTH
jgi:hypothetical protein